MTALGVGGTAGWVKGSVESIDILHPSVNIQLCRRESTDCRSKSPKQPAQRSDLPLPHQLHLTAHPKRAQTHTQTPAN